MSEFDVIILGGGPGGYIAAERLGHAGSKVLLIEADALGGTCLNWGCIPTKTLLNAAKTYHHAKHGQAYGVNGDSVTVDWGRMQSWKADVVGKLVAGVGAAEKQAGVTVIKGHGTFEGPGRVSVNGETHTSRHVVLATGSVPFVPAVPGRERPNCFVYRTIEDLEAMQECGARSTSGVVVGGVPPPLESLSPPEPSRIFWVPSVFGLDGIGRGRFIALFASCSAPIEL